MIDIDALGKLAKDAVARGEEIGEEAWYSEEEFACNMLMHPDDAAYAEAATPDVLLALIAEVRALRAKLETPIFTAGPYGEGLLGLEGANPITAIQVFMHTPWPVTVFYGDKKIYTSMAAFLEAHPEKQP
jgi:hypothetical protein